MKITLEQIDQKRKEGYRPGVVTCFIADKKVLFFYKNEYKTWMFPQTGIDNKKTPEETINEKLIAETGKELVENSTPPYEFIYEKELKFGPGKRNLRELRTDDNTKTFMIGKHYYFYVVNTSHIDIDISNTDFDQYFWMDHSAAKYLTEKMIVKNKAKIVATVLDVLKEKNYIE